MVTHCKLVDLILSSFEILLETISHYSVTGYLMQCGDGIWRRVHPFVFILAADYEEQYIM
jgi:hypothetical protein